jgi:pyroglutamyl-peptidase
MHLIGTKYPDLRGGFVHVPYAPEQVPGGTKPSMPIDVIARGVTIIADTCLATSESLVR